MRASPTPTSGEPVESVTPTPTPAPDPGVHKPVITILSPAPNSTTTEEAVRITGKATSENAILQVMINGEPVSLTGEEHAREFSHRVTSLKIGENLLVIAAWDDFGNIGTANIRIVRQ